MFRNRTCPLFPRSRLVLKLFVRAALRRRMQRMPRIRAALPKTLMQGRKLQVKMVLRSAMQRARRSLLRERRVPQHPPWERAPNRRIPLLPLRSAPCLRDQIRSPHVPCLQESELKNLTSRRFLQAASRTATKWTSLTYSARSAFRSTACRRSNSIYYSSSRASGAFDLFGMIGFRSQRAVRCDERRKMRAAAAHGKGDLPWI